MFAAVAGCQARGGFPTTWGMPGGEAGIQEGAATRQEGTAEATGFRGKFHYAERKHQHPYIPGLTRMIARLRIPPARDERHEPFPQRRYWRCAGISRCVRLAAALALLLAARALAQGPGRRADAVFQHLNREAGLPSPIVQALAQDSQGFLWVGTGSGISRWDGYRFRNYQYAAGVAGSLPDNDVYAMYTDPRGRLWIGTRSRGVARYDPAEDNFRTYVPAGNSRNFGTVYAMVTDGAGVLWVGSRGGIDRLDPDKGTFTPVPLDGTTGPVPVVSLARDRSGRVWAGTPVGLFRSDAAGKHFERQNIFGGATARVWRLLFDDAGRLWIGTTAGAWVLEPFAQQAIEIHESGPGPSLLDQEPVDAICEARPGVIWLGTLGEGIVAVNERTRETHRIVHDAAYPTSLPSDSVIALLTDKEGSVWVGTTNGVGRTHPGGGILSFFGATGVPGQSDRIPDTGITAVLPISQGRLWLGLNSNGAELVSLAGGKLTPLRHIAAGVRSPLPVGQANALATAPDGSVFIGTANWVFRVDANGRGLAALPQPPVRGIRVDALLDEGDTLWIGSHRGLWRTNALHSLREHPEPVALPLTSPEITVLARGAGNDLWVATANELVRYDTVSHTAERIPVDPSDAGGLPAAVTSILLDRQNRLWATTWGAGVCLLEGRDAQGKPRFRTLIEGLPNTNADDILQGPKGRLWVSTDDGFAVIDPKTLAVTPLRQDDRVAISAYWVKSGARTVDGRLIFGGDGGLTVVDPEKVHLWRSAAPAVVTDILAGGKPVPWDLFNEPDRNAVLRIRHDGNSVEIGFAGLDYTGPKREQYAYKLKGFDKDWIPTPATRRVASFTNLPPGHYTLELRSSNRDGVWGSARKIAIVVVPAWYQTLWARMGALLLLLLILTAAYRTSTACHRARQRDLERHVEERTAELRKTAEELQESRRQLEQMAHSDPLTGLPNRRMFSDYFRRLLASARRHEDSSFTLFLFDLDKFKDINDAWGHDAGDAWLKAVATRINGVMRQSDCFARVGGDEFAVLVSDPIDQGGIATLCALLASSVCDPLAVERAVLSTTLSIGVATYPQDGIEEVSLFKAADVALYRVKHAGGNGWQMHSDAKEKDAPVGTPAAHPRNS